MEGRQEVGSLPVVAPRAAAGGHGEKARKRKLPCSSPNAGCLSMGITILINTSKGEEMQDLLTRILERKNELFSVIKEKEKALRKYPEGSLIINKNHGRAVRRIRAARPLSGDL